MSLYVIAEYRCREIHYQPGQILEVTRTEAMRLIADAPGCFSLKAPDQPPADKMIRRSKRK
jgi:hypothetical protein